MARISHLIFFLFVSTGCDKSDPVDQLLLPSNLLVNIVLSDDGSGDVAIVASADNVNFFQIYFGDEPNEIPVKNSDGKANHSYTQSGNYTIKVTAHATAAQFVEKEVTVEIALQSDGGIVTIPTTGYTSPTSYDGLTLVWEDDFTGTALNAEYWTPEIGRGANGWGNNELQYYRAENNKVQDGHLIITAKKEAFADAQYTSSRLVTTNKKTFQYGRVDIRAVLPKGQGLWPALWMLGSSFQTLSWPRCGEIDIMEMVGGAGREKTVHGTLHWDNAGTYACTCGDDGYSLSSGIFADEFHVFSIIWNENTISWYVDNVQHHVINISPSEMSEFDAPFFFIFNVAVGGNWPGSPNTSTTFPQHMIVDYIRVFQ